jgi:hypothetical protein
MADRAFWALRAHPPATAPPPPPVPEAPEEPKDCIVILTFENGRRDPSCASLMTAADARSEADVWRKRKPDSANPGRVTAAVHKIGEPLP